MSKFSSKLLEYYTSQSSSEIYLDNLKRMHPTLDENNIYTLALLSINPAIPEDERAVFKKCLELKNKEIQKQVEEFNRLMYIAKQPINPNE